MHTMNLEGKSTEIRLSHLTLQVCRILMNIHHFQLLRYSSKVLVLIYFRTFPKELVTKEEYQQVKKQHDLDFAEYTTLWEEFRKAQESLQEYERNLTELESQNKPNELAVYFATIINNLNAVYILLVIEIEIE